MRKLAEPFTAAAPTATNKLNSSSVVCTALAARGLRRRLPGGTQPLRGRGCVGYADPGTVTVCTPGKVSLHRRLHTCSAWALHVKGLVT